MKINNEEIAVDVEAVEVTESQEQSPTVTIDDYIQYKRNLRKQKQLKKLLKNNQKALRGFGYEYKPIQFPENQL